MNSYAKSAFILVLMVASDVALADINLTVTGKGNPDPTVAVGAPFHYTTNVINNGSTAAGRFSVRFRLSLDTYYDQDKDVLIGDFDVLAGLAAGASLAINFQSTCPNVPAGIYYVVWRIDFADEVVESNEDDNYIYFGTPVIVFTTVPGTTPIIGSGPSATPALALPGEPVAFTVSASGDAGDVLQSWLFGDGATGTDRDPFHIYLAKGTYTVRVLVSDGTYGSTAETVVTVNGTPTESQAAEFFQQRIEMDADAVILALTQAGIVALDGLAVDVDLELDNARVLANTLVIASNDPQAAVLYAKKAATLQKAVAKLKASILACQQGMITKVSGEQTRFADGRPKAQALIATTIKLANTTNKTLFKSLPKVTPGTGGGKHCPSYIIEEVGAKTAGFHFAGEVVKFKISTAGNAPWPDDAEIRIIDTARFSGKNSNKDGGFTQKPPPKDLTLTMGPDAGASRIEVRCGNELPKYRVLYNKGAKPVKTPGGGGGGGGGGGPYDGTYTGSGQTVSPLGTATSTGTFTVTNGFFTDPDGYFTGNVDASGNFTGNWHYIQGGLPIPMKGVFSNTAPFTLTGNIGTTVSGTFTLQKK